MNKHYNNKQFHDNNLQNRISNYLTCLNHSIFCA